MVAEVLSIVADVEQTVGKTVATCQLKASVDSVSSHTIFGAYSRLEGLAQGQAGVISLAAPTGILPTGTFWEIGYGWDDPLVEKDVQKWNTIAQD
ncbi:unnamed protein product [Cylicocyclus nassatus]|uniref:Uncharacterized protein n=1 Tax=Cylicocyclus nassatus TaxID=53992 RepID=A0AA36DJZ7_CYLNA|nr:unnamed protein product [Cylicocyclus nassatus]